MSVSETAETVMLADVALPIPLPRALTYLVPEKLAATATPGRRVLCTLGSRRIVGVVVAVREGEKPKGAKPILSVLDGISLPEDLVVFVARLASYYLAPIGEVVRLALPPADKEAARVVEEPTLFSEAKGISVRQVQWVLPTEVVETSIKAGPARLLAILRAHGALPLSRLEDQFGGARATVKKLRELGLVTVEERDAIRDPFFMESILRDTELAPTDPQQVAMDALAAALEPEKGPTTFLLHGVTGSGKTEVYLRAIAEAKRLGRGTIMLVPEIALTPQLVSRFRARFGDDVAVLHSGLTPRERFTEDVARLGVEPETVVSLTHGAQKIGPDAVLVLQLRVDLRHAPIEDLSHRDLLALVLVGVGHCEQRHHKVGRALRGHGLHPGASRCEVRLVGRESGDGGKQAEPGDGSRPELREAPGASFGRGQQRGLGGRQTHAGRGQPLGLGQRLALRQQQVCASSVLLPCPGGYGYPGVDQQQLAVRIAP